MKTSSRSERSRKEVTHERIVKVAARVIRRSGYGGTGVADIMQEAGLTHGGFYSHFASREALLAEAADRAGAEAVAAATRITDRVPAEQGLEALLRHYLSALHLNNAELGCPIAALGSEMPRQAAQVRHCASGRIKEMIDVVARQFPDRGQPEAYERAFVFVATMAGALTLARAVDDTRLSNLFLESALRHLLAEKI